MYEFRQGGLQNALGVGIRIQKANLHLIVIRCELHRDRPLPKQFQKWKILPDTI